MAKRKFMVGDKVRVMFCKAGCLGALGKIGVITKKASSDGLLDNRPGINIETEAGQIWRINEDAKLEFLGHEEKTIVIYSKENKVIAFDKSTKERAEARCNPADEFDFYTGARLAFYRLINNPEEKNNPFSEEATMFAKAVVDCIHSFEKEGMSHYEALNFVKDLIKMALKERG